MILKNFVVFEGIDGSGTSTQISILKKRSDSQRFFFTSEPTDSETGLFLRKMLKGDVKLDAKTTAFLFAADRNEHLYGSSGTNCGVVRQTQANKIVISDRYLFSSLAYQSVTCGEELPRRLNESFPLPEILFFFEIDPCESLKRVDSRGEREIYEEVTFLKETEERYKKVVAEYEAMNTGMKIIRIDASRSIEEVSKIIARELKL